MALIRTSHASVSLPSKKPGPAARKYMVMPWARFSTPTRSVVIAGRTDWKLWVEEMDQYELKVKWVLHSFYILPDAYTPAEVLYRMKYRNSEPYDLANGQMAMVTMPDIQVKANMTFIRPLQMTKSVKWGKLSPSSLHSHPAICGQTKDYTRHSVYSRSNSHNERALACLEADAYAVHCG